MEIAWPSRWEPTLDLLEAPVDRPHTGLAKIELNEASDKRINVHNDLFEDRRPGQYASLSNIKG